MSTIINKNINKIIHEPVRLDILNLLYELKYADFLFLLNECNVTRGNLSSHLSKLAKVGYIETKKGYNFAKPMTSYKITRKGETELEGYKKTIRGIFLD